MSEIFSNINLLCIIIAASTKNLTIFKNPTFSKKVCGPTNHKYPNVHNLLWDNLLKTKSLIIFLTKYYIFQIDPQEKSAIILCKFGKGQQMNTSKGLNSQGRGEVRCKTLIEGTICEYTNT